MFGIKNFNFVKIFLKKLKILTIPNISFLGILLRCLEKEKKNSY